MPSTVEQYLSLIVLMLDARKSGLTTLEDVVMDHLDNLWFIMTDEEFEYVRSVSLEHLL